MGKGKGKDPLQEEIEELLSAETVERLECEYCGSSLANKKSLTKHQKNLHSALLEEPEPVIEEEPRPKVTWVITYKGGSIWWDTSQGPSSNNPRLVPLILEYLDYRQQERFLRDEELSRRIAGNYLQLKGLL